MKDRDISIIDLVIFIKRKLEIISQCILLVVMLNNDSFIGNK